MSDINFAASTPTGAFAAMTELEERLVSQGGSVVAKTMLETLSKIHKELVLRSNAGLRTDEFEQVEAARKGVEAACGVLRLIVQKTTSTLDNNRSEDQNG